MNTIPWGTPCQVWPGTQDKHREQMLRVPRPFPGLFVGPVLGQSVKWCYPCGQPSVVATRTQRWPLQVRARSSIGGVNDCQWLPHHFHQATGDLRCGANTLRIGSRGRLAAGMEQMRSGSSSNRTRQHAEAARVYPHVPSLADQTSPSPKMARSARDKPYCFGGSNV